MQHPHRLPDPQPSELSPELGFSERAGSGRIPLPDGDRPDGARPRSAGSASGRLASESGRLSSESGRLSAGSGRWPAPWLPSREVVEFTDLNFREEVLESDLPVVVDFWADTCVPCRRQEPTIERLGAEMEGRFKVGRLNVYDQPHTPDLFQVKGVPHLMVVHQGEVLLELVGDHTIEQLRSYLDRLGF